MITLGVDIGSLTGKALVLQDGEIVAWHLIPTGPDSLETGSQVCAAVLAKAGLEMQQLDMIISTGYGRIVIPFANKNLSEISCHAKGTSYFFPEARTILDMGGQDCKAIRCEGEGKVADFLMNDKCAAGAGRSVGIVAELLKVPLAEVGPLSLQATSPVPVSSTCVVFARSEILAYLRQGVPKADILAGACEALANRVCGMLRRVGLQEQFVITGGIAKNLGVVRRLEEKLGMSAHICFEPQIVGALGAAIHGRELLEKRGRKPRRRGPLAAVVPPLSGDQQSGSGS